MCGLVGMAGNLNQPEKKMFRDMLLFDVVRGQDSTGVAIVPLGTAQKVVVEKDVGSPLELWQYYQKGVRVFDGRGVVNNATRCLIGHNRATTVGNTTVENAHPFTFGKVTGAHNGTLTNIDSLLDHKEFEVDSQALYNHISKRGLADAWKSFYGAAALSFWDEEDQTINLIRNNQRPLFYTYSEKRDAIFWASEEWMILAAAKRNNVKLCTNAEGRQQVFQMEEDVHYSWKPTSVNIEVAGREKLEKKTWTQPKSTNIGGNTTAAGRNSAVGFPRHGKGLQTPTTSTATQQNPLSFNRSWHAGKKRGDKNFKGLVIGNCKLIYSVGQGVRIPRIEADILVDGPKGTVQIFPRSLEEYTTWQQRIATYPSGNYRVQSRGRVISRNETKKEVILGVASSVVEVMSRDERIKLGLLKEFTPTTNNVVQLTPPQKEEEDVEMYMGYGGQLVLREELDKQITQAGGVCCWCSADLEVADAEDFLWHDRESCACATCAHEVAWHGYINLKNLH